MRDQITRNGDVFLYNILWSDETKFTNCGVFNRHNEHVWSIENPEENREVRPQVRFGINVWAGILGGRILGPYLFEENLTSAGYLNFLSTTFQDYLMDIPLATLERLWFQQDGAPAHNSRNVRQFLHEQFPNRWIGNGGFVEWPARSPDLTPLDFYLWGALKDLVYKRPIHNREELSIRILNAFATLCRRGVYRAVKKINKKVNDCIRANGNIFEHLRRN